MELVKSSQISFFLIANLAKISKLIDKKKKQFPKVSHLFG